VTAEAKVGAEVLGYPHPGCFGKRGCKLLKTKEGSGGKKRKERYKRLQAAENMGFATPTRPGQAETRRHGDPEQAETPHPPVFL